MDNYTAENHNDWINEQQDKMDDYILRSDAIDVVAYAVDGKDSQRLIMGLPPMQSEHRKGHWIKSDWNGAEIQYTCSECDNSIITNSDYIKKHQWCFSCGADMR